MYNNQILHACNMYLSYDYSTVTIKFFCEKNLKFFTVATTTVKLYPILKSTLHCVIVSIEWIITGLHKKTSRYF